jgi:uncharacterized membrane protein YphA (DoxX/SURF4 family)
MNQYLDKMKKYAPVVLRMGLGFVFMYFGWQSVSNPSMFMGLVPAWTTAIVPASALVFIHGTFEIIAGVLLFSGYFTRLISILLFLDLLHIISLLGWDSISVRDFGLATSMLAVFLWGN